MIDKLVERVFITRNLAHLEHWKTENFARHTALGDFYDSIIDKIDGIVEAYQGAFGKIKVGEIDQPKMSDVIIHLEEELVWINTNREKITKGICAIDNLLQGLEGDYLVVLYKLKNLS